MVKFVRSVIFVIQIALVGFGLALAEPEQEIKPDEPAETAEKIEKKPKIAFNEMEYDFGEVQQDNSITHNFTFKNTGETALKIGQIKTSCGCTAALVSKDNIEPGETGEIKVTFQSGKFKGPVTKTITVPSNDPAAPQTILKLKGNVKVEIDVQPASLNFGDIPKGEARSMDVTVTQPDGKPFKITKIESSDAIKTKVSPEGPAGSYQVEVGLNAQENPGIFSDILKIYTDYQNQIMVSVHVRARITGDVVVTPAQLFLGSIKKGTNRSGTLKVVNAGKDPLEITSLKVDPAYLTAEYKVIEQGKRYEVLISIQPDAPVGNIRGMLTIRTNNPKESAITVPVTAIVHDDVK